MESSTTERISSTTFESKDEFIREILESLPEKQFIIDK